MCFLIIEKGIRTTAIKKNQSDVSIRLIYSNYLKRKTTMFKKELWILN